LRRDEAKRYRTIIGGKRGKFLKSNALKINEKDNVAIAMHNIAKDEAVVVDGQSLLEVIEDIEAGHKIALSAIASGERVYRYGEPIVETTRAISPGEWVHVHNTQPIPGELKE
jgi:hypothetical protein